LDTLRQMGGTLNSHYSRARVIEHASDFVLIISRR